jgi:uncharacterized membrane protein YkoI
LLVVPCIAAAQFTVHVAIHQPATAAAIGQVAKIVPVAQSTEAQKAAPETITLLTQDGEVTLTTDNPPKVGDVITANGRRMKIVAIDPQGQYKTYTFRNATDPAASGEDKYRTYAFRSNVDPGGNAENGGTVILNNRGYAQEAEQDQGSTERREPEGQLSEQEIHAQRLMEHALLEAHAQRQAELVRQAKIPMDQAIQIALRETPGTVVEARLIGERGTVTYFISILKQNGTGNEIAYVLVNALDGRSMMKTGERKQER